MSQTLLNSIRHITPTSPANVRQLADQHLTSDDPKIRLACLEAITRLGHTTRYDDLNYLTKDHDKWIRIQTLRALIAIGEDDEYATASDLMTYFKDPEPIVRLEAIYTMHRHNLQPYIEVNAVVQGLWHDDARVWESRGEAISAVMMTLFGKYDPSLFKQKRKTGSFISTSPSEYIVTNDDSEDDITASEVTTSNSEKIDTSQFRFVSSTPQQNLDLLHEDTVDTDLPNWLDDVDTAKSDLTSHSLDDLPDWLSGDVDGTLDDFTNLIQEDDASSLDWLHNDDDLLDLAD